VRRWDVGKDLKSEVGMRKGEEKEVEKLGRPEKRMANVE
jgi:hypothetical protein